MARSTDGPATTLFTPVSFKGGTSRSAFKRLRVSREMKGAWPHAPSGACVCWGIPFKFGTKIAVANSKPVALSLQPFRAQWLVFQHTADRLPSDYNEHGIISPARGTGHLREHAADYVIEYVDGSEGRIPVHYRYQVAPFRRPWGENCVEAVAHRKPCPVRAHHEQQHHSWGFSQTRASAGDGMAWTNWLYAWKNPHPDREISGLRIEPAAGTVILFGLAAGGASSMPLRWRTRRKALLRLRRGEEFDPTLDERGVLQQVQLDLGQVISAQLRLKYPDRTWSRSYNNQLPETDTRAIVVEYTSHPDAAFHLSGGITVSVAALEGRKKAGRMHVVPPATQRVRIRVLDKGSGTPVPVKLHVHGTAGEYLAPIDRHRQPNDAWFEDYSTDFVHAGRHRCTYIPGETRVDLPRGRVYLEVSKGYEIRPQRLTARVTGKTDEIVVELDKVLDWRARGWVTADTHVHFLSPQTALLEGAAEGVNVINLLASQWGELMTNVGDFDGRTTHGSKAAGGDGEYLVRVGTENRQHVMGHISLLGYEGDIIAPMTTGGPDEAALGDPVEVLLTEWARQCHAQKGVVILPHFPNPRLENAATIVAGEVDGIEMTSWGNLYGGISPYSLSDWYRYLNCGYLVPAVAGTDKMSAYTPVGCVRTYALIDGEFTYSAWMRAIRAGRTFVTYGPLLEFSVEGEQPGARITMKAGGGTVDVYWKAASVTVPMSQVELVVNGEIREASAVSPEAAEGHWRVKVNRSSWLALRVRGHYRDKPEIIAAHSSPVAVALEGSEFMAAADALTILEQIEGALAYLDTIGTRADTAAYKRMRMTLVGAHRRLHNRMHAAGMYHAHTPATDHAEHH